MARVQGQAVVTVVSGAALGHEAWRKKELAHWLQVKGLLHGQVSGVREQRVRRGCERTCAFRDLEEGL